MDDKEKIEILKKEIKKLSKENEDLKYRLEINNTDRYKEKLDKLLKNHKDTLATLDALSRKYTELVEHYHRMIEEWKKDVKLS